MKTKKRVAGYKGQSVDLHKIEAAAKQLERKAEEERPGSWDFDAEFPKMWRADARRLRTIARNVRRGNLTRARWLIQDTDTAVRDMLPQRLFSKLFYGGLPWRDWREGNRR